MAHTQNTQVNDAGGSRVQDQHELQRQPKLRADSLLQPKQSKAEEDGQMLLQTRNKVRILKEG